MLNTELKSNGLGNAGTALHPDHKQSPLLKKTALRDVQNDNNNLIRSHPQRSPVLAGRSPADASKFSGTKRQTPESPISPSYLSRNGANGNILHARRQFAVELGQGRTEGSIGKGPDGVKQQELPRAQTQMRATGMYGSSVARPSQMASNMTIPRGGPSVPVHLGNSGNGLTGALSNGLKVKPEIYNPTESEQERQERFAHLQNYLKQCDDLNQRDYNQMLQKLSPAELSRYAIELEKRSMQLTFEEGKQIQMMTALNIFGKSGPVNNPSPVNRQLQSKN